MLTVRSPPKLTVVPAIVVKAGVLASPKVRFPLRLIVPAVVILDTVPELNVNGCVNVIDPLVTLITSVAATVFAV